MRNRKTRMILEGNKTEGIAMSRDKASEIGEPLGLRTSAELEDCDCQIKLTVVPEPAL